jgi:hypothetical protein
MVGRSPAEREAEIVCLQQQLIVLKRTAPTRPRLKATDRLIFLCLYRLFPSLLDASIIFRPKRYFAGTELASACSGAGKAAGGRPDLPSRPTSEASFDGSVGRTLSGARRAFMANCSNSASRSPSRRGPPSEGWKTFLRNHTPHIVAIDMFVVPTTGFGCSMDW